MLNRVLKFFNKQEPETIRETIEDLIEEIDELIEDTEEIDSSIYADERKLLGNVLNLRDLTANDVMVARANIVAAPSTITPEELIGLMVEHGFSCIPIYLENLDNIIGSIHIKDILAQIHIKKNLVLSHLMKKNIIGISPSMQTLDLLIEMSKTGHRMAIVADEHGGTDGLVCFSDLIEAIIGDIQDSHHIQPAFLQINKDGTIIADARITLEELTTKINVTLITDKSIEEDIDTLGGLIVSLINRVPVKGEVIKHPNGIEFTILDADPRRIKKVSLLNLPVLDDKKMLCSLERR
ncbi:MAG: CBS domain-containing protein [Proteobacteria bacterium]|nr:CBS domain-containing protein [Pseudomonadota bacterium]